MQIAVSTPYDVVGTSAAAATLTNDFADNTSDAVVSQYLKNLHLDIKYTPKTNNAYILVLIEYCNDTLDAPTNWFPLTTRSASSVEADAFADSGTGMSTTSGIPIVFPGDKTSTASTAITGGLDFNINAAAVRIKVLEVGGSTAGSVWIKITLSS